MKRNSFFFELIKSPPFIFFIILTLLIVLGVVISNHREKAIQMKEDVLYIQPHPGQ
ncbi:MAG: hypothetical protein JXR66_11690 [Bacteroidales bacterium]|nr:hypothetical protein [Bacteroidales bacterium]